MLCFTDQTGNYLHPSMMLKIPVPSGSLERPNQALVAIVRQYDFVVETAR